MSIHYVPRLMEHFRPADRGLLPGPFLSIKLAAAWPAYISFLLLTVFFISPFRIELHSAQEIGLVSLAVVFFLLVCIAQLLMARALAGTMI